MVMKCARTRHRLRVRVIMFVSAALSEERKVEEREEGKRRRKERKGKERRVEAKK